MQIGFVRQNEMTIKEGDEQKKVKYLEMFIKPVFGRVQSFTLSANKSDNENAPSFNIYAHNEKGWINRKSKVGALWMKATDEGEKFMSGHIETPMAEGGKLQISLWRAKPLYEGEVIEGWLYDVNWKPYAPQQEQVSVIKPAPKKEGVYSVNDDDELPF